MKSTVQGRWIWRTRSAINTKEPRNTLTSRGSLPA